MAAESRKEGTAMIPADLDLAAAESATAPILTPRASLTLAVDDDVMTFALTHLPARREYIVSIEHPAEEYCRRARIAVAFSGATDAHCGHDHTFDLWYVLGSFADDAVPPDYAPR
jgi:hypothetical protein